MQVSETADLDLELLTKGPEADQDALSMRWISLIAE